MLLMNLEEHIFVVGFNHHLVGNNERGEIIRIANQEISKDLIAKYNINALNILQTCNRWELYGYGDINGTIKLINKLSTNKIADHQLLCLRGIDALKHIFIVASGLDSMVLGDQEILSQFRKSFLQSKEQKTLDGYMERLANTSIQAAKEIRKKTLISQGTTSLSYAAIQIIKQIQFSSSAKILLIGLGKFGQAILKNLNEYFPLAKVSLCNRTKIKSEENAKKYQAEIVEWKDCPSVLADYDVVISAVESKEILFSHENTASLPENIIDLSMPSPFSKEIREDVSIKYYTIDDAAKIVNESLENRKASILPAMQIIENHVQAFVKWSATYAHSNVLKEWKNKLNEASEVCPFFQTLDSKESAYYIQKSMGHFAKFVKSEKAPNESKEVLSTYLQSQHT